MIDTDKYEGHTRGPWRYYDDEEHDCWVFEGEAMEAMGAMSATDKQLLFLPMAHVFAKVLEIAIIKMGITTVVDGSIDNLGPVRRKTWVVTARKMDNRASTYRSSQKMRRS